ncbi:hypothetical protein HK101_011474 [Irineochytrium annulatum]|nr:hypothetical protein HK101_011474 [Irineochytrium annulatum]
MRTCANVEVDVKHITVLFEQKETEANWHSFDDALAKFTKSVRASADAPGFFQAVRKLEKPLKLALASDRSRLTTTAMTLVEELATTLGSRFEPMAEGIIDSLLNLCARSNKVFVNSASKTLKIVIDNAGAPSATHQFRKAIDSPTMTLRMAAVDCVIRSMGVNGARLEGHMESIEHMIRVGTEDKAKEVRDLSRAAFDQMRGLFPHRVDRFILSLSEEAMKKLKVTRPQMPVRTTIDRPIRTTKASVPRIPVMVDDDSASLHSETPSFGNSEDEEHNAIPATRRRPRQSTLPAAIEAALPQQSAENPTTAHHRSDHVGGAQRVLRVKNGEPPAQYGTSRIGGATTKAKAQRVPLPQAAAAPPVAKLAVVTTSRQDANLSALRVKTDRKPAQHGREMFANDDDVVSDAQELVGKRTKKRPTASERDRSTSGNHGYTSTSTFNLGGATYEDSDTDLLTDNEVLRSPDGSESDVTASSDVGAGDNHPEAAADHGVSALASRSAARAAEVMTASMLTTPVARPFKITTGATVVGDADGGMTLKKALKSMTGRSLSPPTTAPPLPPTSAAILNARDRHVAENVDVLKAAEEALSAIASVERAQTLSGRSQSEASVYGLPSRSSPQLRSTAAANADKRRSLSGIPVVTVSSDSLRHKSPSPQMMSRTSPSPFGSPQRRSLLMMSAIPEPSFDKLESPKLKEQPSVSGSDSNNDAVAPRPASSASGSSSRAPPSDLRTAFTVESDSPSPREAKKSISWSEETIEIPEPTRVVMSPAKVDVVAPIDPAAEMKGAVEDGLGAVWELTRRTLWEGVSGEELVAVLDLVLRKLEVSAVEQPASLIKQGLVLLRELVDRGGWDVERRASDVLTAILGCAGRPEISADDQLEIEYEVDAVVEAIEKSLNATDIVGAISRAMRSEFISNDRLCFEILSRSLQKSTADSEAVANAEFDWEPVFRHVVEGLDSHKMTTRKSAFDCSVAICKAKPALKKELLKEVASRCGDSREKVVRGMMERRLN